LEALVVTSPISAACICHALDAGQEVVKSEDALSIYSKTYSLIVGDREQQDSLIAELFHRGKVEFSQKQSGRSVMYLSGTSVYTIGVYNLEDTKKVVQSIANRTGTIIHSSLSHGVLTCHIVDRSCKIPSDECEKLTSSVQRMLYANGRNCRYVDLHGGVKKLQLMSAVTNQGQASSIQKLVHALVSNSSVTIYKNGEDFRCGDFCWPVALQKRIDVELNAQGKCFLWSKKSQEGQVTDFTPTLNGAGSK
jgi:hypothetical protein